MEPKVNRELLGLKIHPLGKKLNYSFLLALLAPHPLFYKTGGEGVQEAPGKLRGRSGW